MNLRKVPLTFVRNNFTKSHQICSLFRLENNVVPKPWLNFGGLNLFNGFKNRTTGRFYCDKPDNNVESKDMRLNLETIQKLERLALVDFGNEAGVKRLEEAVKFASLILEVNTENVKPMYTVLEDRAIELRPDVVKETNRDYILRNAVITEEHYFVAPPGNKPLKKS